MKTFIIILFVVGCASMYGYVLTDIVDTMSTLVSCTSGDPIPSCR